MIRIIIYIILGLIILSFFGISLRDVVDSPAGQDNFSFLWQLVIIGWDYIARLALDIWNWALSLIGR